MEWFAANTAGANTMTITSSSNADCALWYKSLAQGNSNHFLTRLFAGSAKPGQVYGKYFRCMLFSFRNQSLSPYSLIIFCLFVFAQNGFEYVPTCKDKTLFKAQINCSLVLLFYSLQGTKQSTKFLLQSWRSLFIDDFATLRAVFLKNKSSCKHAKHTDNS